MQKGCLFSLLSPRRPFSPPQCPTFGDLLPLTNLVWPFLRPPATGLKVSMFLSLNSPSFRLRIPSSIPSGKLLLILLPFLFFFISFFWVFYYVMLFLISKFFNDGEGGDLILFGVCFWLIWYSSKDKKSLLPDRVHVSQKISDRLPFVIFSCTNYQSSLTDSPSLLFYGIHFPLPEKEFPPSTNPLFITSSHPKLLTLSSVTSYYSFLTLH